MRYFNIAEVEMKVDQGTIFCDTPITGIAGVGTQCILGGQTVHNRGLY